MQIKGKYLPLFLILFCFLTGTSFAKVLPGPSKDSSLALLGLYEDTLKDLQLEKVKPHTSDQAKLKANERFSALLQKALSLPGSFDYPFDSLSTIANLTSPDKQFRIFNWNVPKADGSFYYFGFIQSLDPVKNVYHIYTLQDKTADIANGLTTTCTADKWLGMLYYKIIPEKYEDKSIYVMLAWQGYNKIITHKVIDVITLNNQGVPSFGKAIFKKPPPGFKGVLKRIIFQYSSTAYMSIKYDSKKNMIQFDHLGPIDDGLVGQYQYYAPGFQVDGLAFKENGFEYIANIDARNPASPIDKDYSDPEHNPRQINNKAIYKSH
jgi:hypothetical protein